MKSIRQLFQWLSIQSVKLKIPTSKIFIEPGRSIVEAGITLYTVAP